MEHDAWFFVGVFVFIFLIWIATGGPLHPLAFTGPRLSAPQELGGGTYLSFPRAPFGIGGSNVSLPGSSNGESSSYGNSGTSEVSVPTSSGGVAFSPSSPYRTMVSMNHSISNASSSNPAREYIQLSIMQNARTPVKLTGWMFMSGATGKKESIPRGTTVPTSGVVNAVEDIVLQPGENAIIISGESPVGASFRENKCIGYLGTFQQFSPPLPQNCPLASNELSSFFGTTYIYNPTCIDYANTLSRCQVAMPTQTTKISNKCQSFLENYLNYNGCVAVHKNDSDFNGTTWRIYLGREDHLWRAKYEIVKLLDANGKTVDAFSY